MNNTENKTIYSPTIFGLYSKVAKDLNFPDWLTPNPSNETWHTEGKGDTLTDLGGNPDISSKKELRDQKKNYFSPILGASQRWKASINNDTNPLNGLFRTVVPAAATSAAIYYSPIIAKTAIKNAPQIVKTIVWHPKLVAPIGKRLASKAGIDLVTGMMGGNAVDKATDLLTNKSWGEFISPYLGISEDAADWLNPGYAIGPAI